MWGLGGTAAASLHASLALAGRDACEGLAVASIIGHNYESLEGLLRR